MTPQFVLELSPEGIGLYHRTGPADGEAVWVPVGSVPLDAEDLAQEVAFLRRTALELDGPGFATRILLPNDVIHYTRLAADPLLLADPARLERAARETVARETGVEPGEIVIDMLPDGEGVAIAAVETVTLEEAETFAAGHRLHPVCFVGSPPPGLFPGEAFFGRTRFADEFLGKEAPLRREPRPFAPAPAAAGTEAAAEPGRPTESGIEGEGGGEAEPGAGAGDASGRGAFAAETEPAPATAPATAEPSLDPGDAGPIPFTPRPRPMHATSAPSRPGASLPAAGHLDPGHIRIEPADPADAALLEGLVVRLDRQHKPVIPWKRIAPFAAVVALVLLLGWLWMSIRPTPLPEELREPATAKIPGTDLQATGKLPKSPAAETPPPPDDQERPGLAERVDTASARISVPETEKSRGEASTAGLPEAPGAEQSTQDAQSPIASPSASSSGSERAGEALAEGKDGAISLAGPVTNETAARPPALSPPAEKREGNERAGETITIAGVEPTAPLPLPLKEGAPRLVETPPHEQSGIALPSKPEAPSLTPSTGEDELFLPESLPAPEGSDAISPAAFGEHLEDTTPEADRPLDKAGTAGPASSAIEPTPEGTPTPEGILLHAGRPEPAPPPRPAAPLPAARQPVPALRPPPRPAKASLQESAAPAAAVATALAGLRPRARPAGLPTGSGPKTVKAPKGNVPAGPKIVRLPGFGKPQYTERAHAPSSTTVARAATVENGLPSGKLILVGITGTSSAPKALVRFSNGRIKRVKVGDRLDGGKVIAIGEGRLIYLKGRRKITLTMPRG